MKRGVGNINPMKMAKYIMELERIKGVRQESTGKGSLDGNNFAPKYSKKDLAEDLHISQR